MEENIILKRSDVEKHTNECHERVVYWEKVYRIVREQDKNNENLKSYKRQIDIWLAKYEIWRSILNG